MIKRDELQIRFSTDGQGQVSVSLAEVARGVDAVGAASARTSPIITKVGAAIQALPVAAFVAFLTRGVIEAEQLNARLVTFVGTQERANQVLEDLRGVAAATGGSINELTATWLRLEQAGLRPTAERLVAMSNIAAATGQSLQLVAEAVSDATQGQSQALRRLGVGVREENDKLLVSFRGVTTEIDKTAEAVGRYIDKLGSEVLSGAAARDANTLAGALGNLADAAVEVAKAFSGPLLEHFREDVKTTTAELEGLARFIRFLAGDVGLIEKITQRVEAIDAQVERLRAGPNPGAVARAQREINELLEERVLLLERQEKMLSTPRRGKTAGDEPTPDKELSEDTEQLIARLKELGATYGKTRAEALEYEKATALAKAATDAERKAIEQAYDAAIRSVSAAEAATRAERDQSKATRESEEATLKRKRAEESALRARREMVDLDERQAEALARLVDSIDPYTAKLRELKDIQEALSDAVFRGEMSPDRAAELARLAEDQIFNGDPARIEQHARENFDVFEDAILRGADDLGNAIADTIYGGGDWADLARRIARDMARAFIQQRFIVPLQARMLGGAQGAAFSTEQLSALGGRGFETQPGFMGPPMHYNSGAGQSGGLGGFMAGGRLGSVVGGLGSAYGAYQSAGSGDVVGSTLSGAAAGAQIGSIIPGLGTVIGAVIGAVVGLIAGIVMKPDPPSINVIGSDVIGTSGYRRLAPGSQFSTAFGGFAFASIDEVSGEDREAFKDAIRQFDQAIADRLEAHELALVQEAFRTDNQQYREGDISPDEILNRRLDVVVRTLAPQWQTYLNGFEDVQDRVEQFVALRGLEKLAEQIDELSAGFDSDPAARLGATVRKLVEARDAALAAFESAIDAQDAVQIEQAASKAADAVREWARAAIESAERIEAAQIALGAQSRAFEVQMAQRIAGVSGGGLGGVLGVLAGNRDATRGLISSARTPDQAMQYLNEFIATVDAWLAQSSAEVQRVANEQRQAIIGAAQERAAAQQDADEAQRRALQEQLALAQEWLGVLSSAQAMLDELRFSAANPLGAQLRFDALSRESDALFELFRTQSGGARAGTANRLLDILGQQQQLGTELFQRPSPEALALYNQLLARVNEVQAVAAPEAERARQLQEELNAMVAGVGDLMSFLSGEERAQLDRINQDEQAALDKLNETALADYEWALGEGRRIQAEQSELLQRQLDELTGGKDIQTFIAETQAQARDALFDIRDSINLFLGAIATTGAALDPNNPGGPGWKPVPGQPGLPQAGGTVVVSPIVNVYTGSGDPATIGAVVRNEIIKSAPQFATLIKRQLANA